MEVEHKVALQQPDTIAYMVRVERHNASATAIIKHTFTCAACGVPCDVNFKKMPQEMQTMLGEPPPPLQAMQCPLAAGKHTFPTGDVLFPTRPSSSGFRGVVNIRRSIQRGATLI